MYIRKISDQTASELKSKGAAREIKPDIWNIKVKNGVYDIDIASLMKSEPVIVAGDEGRYILSLSSVFKGKKKLVKKTKK